MVNFAQLVKINLDDLEKFADEWKEVSKKMEGSNENFKAKVLGPLKREDWDGEAGRAAKARCSEINDEIAAVAKQADSVFTYVDKTVNGGGAYAGFRELQNEAVRLNGEAIKNGMSISDSGKVEWAVIRSPGPMSDEAQNQYDKMSDIANDLQGRVQSLLKEVDDADKYFTDGLKNIFGTTDNFDTESREYASEKDEKDFTDYQTHATLAGVQNAMRYYYNYDDAADLLEHYLEGSGKPYEVDPQTMLKDIPEFQDDVKNTLDEVRGQPAGTFSTSWKDSAPDVDDGHGSLNWYYALNHFEYRLVGEKENGEITYQVEVRKDYNWGTPSEHRSDLEKGPITLEQADIANLHSVGMARDFKVYGRSGEMTVPA